MLAAKKQLQLPLKCQCYAAKMSPKKNILFPTCRLRVSLPLSGAWSLGRQQTLATNTAPIDAIELTLLGYTPKIPPK